MQASSALHSISYSSSKMAGARRKLLSAPILAFSSRIAIEQLEVRTLFGYGWNVATDAGVLTGPGPTLCTCTPNGSLASGDDAGDTYANATEGPDGGTGTSDLALATSQDDGLQMEPAINSEAPVDYFTGTPVTSTIDLESDGFGQPFEVGRAWTGLDDSGLTGNGWENTSLPYMVMERNQVLGDHDGVVSVIDNSQTQLLFASGSETDTSMVPMYGLQDTLTYIPPSTSTVDDATVYNPGLFQMTDPEGNTTTFYDLPRDTDPDEGNSHETDIPGTDDYVTNLYSPTEYAQEPTNQWNLDGVNETSTNTYPFGAFKSMTDAAGNVTSAIYNSSGNLQEVDRTDAVSGAEERFYYSYSTVSNGYGGSASLVSSIALQRWSSGTEAWSTVESVNYTYYTGETSSGSLDPNGRLGDLKLVQIIEPIDGTNTTIQTDYYRYYKFFTNSNFAVYGPTNHPDTTGGGDTTFSSEPLVYSGLKSVFQGASYARLAAVFGSQSSIDAASDSDIQPYADNTYEYEAYDQSSLQPTSDYSIRYRVTSETAAAAGCSCAGNGGVGTYDYSYYINPSGPVSIDDDILSEPNQWVERTTVTLPSDSDVHDEDIEYTNEIGEVMLSVIVDGATGQTWPTYYRYNDEGRLILEANSAALANYNASDPSSYESYSDLVNFGNTTSNLSTVAGLVTLINYASTTTATTTAPGDVAGYMQNQEVEQGYNASASATLVLSLTYLVKEGSNATVYPVASQTVYGLSDGGDARTTTYSYTYYGDTTAYETMTVTGPAIAADQNGSGTANTSETIFDSYGLPVWQVDGNGYIDYTEYDRATGAVLETITDVAPSTVSDPTVAGPTRSGSLPSAMNLTTTYEIDDFGRTTEETTPDGNVTYTVYLDATHETRVYPGWNSTTDTTTGPIQITREYWPSEGAASGQQTVYDEALTSSATPTVSDGVPTGAESISASNILSLSRTLTDNEGQNVETDNYFSMSGITYSQATPQLGTASNNSASGNYFSTTYWYDGRGRVGKTVDPTGTITRQTFNGLNDVTSTWIGTNDTPSSGYWSPTNNDGASNMVEVSANAYDADGNEIESVQYPAGTGSAGRATEYYYDFRDRVIAEMDGAVDDSGMPSGNATSDPAGNDTFVSYYTLDNLGESTVTQVYNAEEQPITFDDGTYNEPSATGAWRFIVSAGISEDGSGAANGNPYLGTSQVGFVTNQGAISQTMNFSAGSYTVSLDAARAAYYDDGNEKIAVLVDGVSAGSFTVTSTSWASESATFNVSAGLHTVTFQGIDPDGTVQIALIGDVSIADAGSTTATPPTVADADFDTPSVDSYAYNIPAPMPNMKMTAYSAASYDDMGEMFNSTVVSVDPSSSDSYNSLTTNDYYDADGNLIASIGPTGAATKYTYDGADRLTGIYVTDGGQLNNSFNVNIGSSGANFFAGNVSGDDVLSQTLYVYDGDGNIIETIESDRFGTDSASAYGPLHSTANTSTGAYARVSFTASYYDAADRDIADVNVGTNGGSAWTRPSSVPSRSSSDLVTSYIFDSAGRLSFETDPNDLITGYAYNLLGEMTATVANWNVATFMGPVYTSSLPTPTDSANQTTEYTYDGDGNETSMTAVMPSGETSQTTSYVYGVTTAQGSTLDDNDLLAETIYPDLTTGDSYGSWSFSGNAGVAGNGSAFTSGNGAAPQGTQVGFLQKNGSISQAVSFASGGTYSISLSAAQRWGDSAEQDIEILVDGTVVDTIEPSGTAYANYSSSSFSVSAGMHTITLKGTDPGGGDLTALIDSLSISGSGAPSFADAGFESPNVGTGTWFAFQYDPPPRESYTYDGTGEETSFTGRDQSVHAYSYDLLGRLSSDDVTSFGDVWDTTTAELGYNYTDQGQLYQATSYNSSGGVLNQVQESYDGYGNLVSDTQADSGSVSTDTPAVSYTYDPTNDDRLTSVEYPDGRTIDYNYGSSGSLDYVMDQISSLSDSSGTIQSYSYEGLDTPLGETDANGVTETTTLDSFGRVGGVSYANSSGGTIDGYNYGYDADGNVLYKQNTAHTSQSALYSYDGLNRLTNYSTGTLNSSNTSISGTPTETQGWNYDAIGNWESSTVNGTTTDRTNNAENEITSVGSASLVYNANGSMVQDQTGQQYVYDAWGRVVTVEDSYGDAIASYTYDALGRRITTSEDDTATDNYFSNQSLVEQQVSGTTTSQFVWGPFYVNQLVQETIGSTKYYVEQDADWNVSSVTNTSGGVVEEYTTGPYGTITVYNGSGGVLGTGLIHSAIGQIIGFQGGWTDTVTGLVHFRSRDLNTGLGNWIEEDPKQYVDGSNVEQFEGCNPASRLDPTGTDFRYGPNWMNVLCANPPSWISTVNNAIGYADDNTNGAYGFLGVGVTSQFGGFEVGIGCTISSDFNFGLGLEGYGYANGGVGPFSGSGGWLNGDGSSSTGALEGWNFGPIGAEQLHDPDDGSTYTGLCGGEGIVGGIGIITGGPTDSPPSTPPPSPKPVPYAPNWINRIVIWAQS